MSIELIVNEIERNQEEYIEFLKELIKSESYNPPGNEINVALKIEKYLKADDIICEIFPFGTNRANLIAYLNDHFKKKVLLYNGHMDVVPPGSEKDWKYPPLSAYIKRKRFIFGRGSTDMKGGLAAMAIALKILKKLNLNLSGNLIFNAVADEETGGKYGTKWCLDTKLKSINCDFAIVGEATHLKPLSNAIILGEKGRIQLKLVVYGISCHASVPFMGENPIYIMNQIIQNLEKINNYIPKVEPPIPLNKLKQLVSINFADINIFNKIYDQNPLISNVVLALTKFTYSVTMIKAGIKENVVPDKCEAKIDFRLLPGQKTDILIEALKKIIKDLGYSLYTEFKEDIKKPFITFKIEEQNEASFWKDWENSKVLESLRDIIERVYKKKPFYFLLPASADANFLRNTNFCPKTVIFGPGVSSTAHAVNEYIEIDDFLNAIKVYTLFAYNFLK